MMDEDQIMLYGSENTTFMDKVCAFVLAMAPLLQHYKGIVQNAGFTVLILITPILFLRTYYILKRGWVDRGSLIAIISLILFNIYTIIIRDFNFMRLGYVLLISGIFLCVSNGSVNISYFFKYAKKIAVLATIIIFFQYITYYVFGRAVDFRPLSLLVSQDVIWVRTSVNYGVAGYMYRPSAFFLEPSHFFLYSFPIITVLLLSEKRNKQHLRTALLLSFGLLLSTSGMGIVVLVGLWALYFIVYKNVTEEDKNVNLFKLINPRNVVVFILLAIVLYLAYRFIPIIHSTIERIFSDEESTNAIDGRVRLVQDYVRDISGSAVWFGTPMNELDDLDFNIPGFFATYIKWGVFGLILSYWFYGQGLFKLRGPYFWLTVIIIVISYFTAHTHGTFYMLYFVLFLMNGYYEGARNWVIDEPTEEDLEEELDEANI